MTRAKRGAALVLAKRLSADSRLRVAFYIRVSTEDQAVNETPRNQIEYLERKYAPNFQDDALEPMQLVGIFSDEGVSGATAFEARPEGARLLDLARAGDVDLVIFLKLDRFGRKVLVIHDAYEQLARYDVAIQSATEQWETRSTTGKMVFGLLAVLAEFERDTLRDRFAWGKDRIARTGRFINGVLPFGYDVVDGKLAPSDKIVEQLGMTEADVARLIIEKVAGGTSAFAVAQWLNAIGVPSLKIWVTKNGNRTASSQSDAWPGNRISRMIHNPLYKGERVLHHASGDIEQDVAALVDAKTWQKARDMLGTTGNKGGMKTLKKTFTYLLGGRIFCASCDLAMQGNIQRDKTWARLYYGCARRAGKLGAKRHGVCEGYPTYINGEQIENKVITDIDTFMADPKAAIDGLRQKVRERQSQEAEQETMSERMQARLHQLEASKHQILKYVVSGRISEDEADKHIDEIARETGILRAELAGVSAHTTVAQALEERLVDLTSTLETAKDRWERARQSNNREAMREVILKLLGSARVYADGSVQFQYLTPSLSNTQSLNDVSSTDGIVGQELLLWGRVA